MSSILAKKRKKDHDTKEGGNTNQDGEPMRVDHSVSIIARISNEDN